MRRGVGKPGSAGGAKPDGVCSTSQLQHPHRHQLSRNFLHDLTSYPIIARLLFRIASANFDEKGGLRAEMAGSAQTMDFLKGGLLEQFSISLMPSPGPIEYCIHNANSPDGAACYLRLPFQARFVPWCKNADALRIANEIKEEDVECNPARIFRPTKRLDINKDPGNAPSCGRLSKSSF